MNMTEKNFSITPSKSQVPLVDREHGFFHSSTFNVEPQVVFDFMRDSSNIERALNDLPDTVENFFELELESAEKNAEGDFEIHWRNAESAKIQGTLNFTLREAPANRGTIIVAVAEFDSFSWKDEEPSTLINFFLRRCKALIETGVIATTKGQPSGREEINESNDRLD